MKTLHRVTAAMGASALLLTLAACGATETPTPTVSAPSCPDQKNVSVVTGASISTSYSLLQSIARTNQCAKYIPPQDIQRELSRQITPEMSTAERINVAENIITAEGIASAPDGLQYHDVGLQSDGRYVFVFTLK